MKTKSLEFAGFLEKSDMTENNKNMKKTGMDCCLARLFFWYRVGYTVVPYLAALRKLGIAVNMHSNLHA